MHAQLRGDLTLGAPSLRVKPPKRLRRDRRAAVLELRSARRTGMKWLMGNLNEHDEMNLSHGGRSARDLKAQRVLTLQVR